MAFTLERPVDDVNQAVTNWRDDAACKSSSPELFFPAGTTGAAFDEIMAAKAVCAVCPVQTQCLRFALVTNQAYGIWGGTTEDERILIKRLSRRRPAALSA